MRSVANLGFVPGRLSLNRPGMAVETSNRPGRMPGMRSVANLGFVPGRLSLNRPGMAVET